MKKHAVVVFRYNRSMMSRLPHSSRMWQVAANTTSNGIAFRIWNLKKSNSTFGRIYSQSVSIQFRQRMSNSIRWMNNAYVAISLHDNLNYSNLSKLNLRKETRLWLWQENNNKYVGKKLTASKMHLLEFKHIFWCVDPPK